LASAVAGDKVLAIPVAADSAKSAALAQFGLRRRLNMTNTDDRLTALDRKITELTALSDALAHPGRAAGLTALNELIGVSAPRAPDLIGAPSKPAKRKSPGNLTTQMWAAGELIIAK
jgi:hypothetical protein